MNELSLSIIKRMFVYKQPVYKTPLLEGGWQKPASGNFNPTTQPPLKYRVVGRFSISDGIHFLIPTTILYFFTVLKKGVVGWLGGCIHTTGGDLIQPPFKTGWLEMRYAK